MILYDRVQWSADARQDQTATPKRDALYIYVCVSDLGEMPQHRAIRSLRWVGGCCTPRRKISRPRVSRGNGQRLRRPRRRRRQRLEVMTSSSAAIRAADSRRVAGFPGRAADDDGLATTAAVAEAPADAWAPDSGFKKIAENARKRRFQFPENRGNNVVTAGGNDRTAGTRRRGIDVWLLFSWRATACRRQ